MTRAVGFISTFLFYKPKCLLTPVIRKFTYAYSSPKGSAVIRSEAGLHCSIYSYTYNNNFCSVLQTKRISYFPTSFIYSSTSQQINRFSSISVCLPMSRKKRKREDNDTKLKKSHDKSKKAKKNRSHKNKNCAKTKNDWYLVSKKNHKKNKKKRKNSSLDFPVDYIETKKRKMYSEATAMPDDKCSDEAHNLLEEAFDSCCQIDSYKRSGSSRNVKVDESKFSKKLNDLLLKDAGKRNFNMENYSRDRACIEENVNEHNKYFEMNRYDDEGCIGSRSRADHKANLIRDAVKIFRKEEWVSGGVGLQRESWQPIEVKYKFKVLSYNVLSQELLMSNPQLYRQHNPAHLNWSYRAPRLMDEFRSIDADIICLQEVEDGHKPFYDELENYGYKGIYKKRTGDKNDGCAIYYRTDKFTLIDYTTVEFQQPESSILDRDNIGIVVKLHPVGWENFPLVVSTTHLLYNPRRHDVKLAQMQVLLSEIERFAYNSKFADFSYHPIILTGDFNLQPYTSVYQLLMSGSLRYDVLDKKFLRMDGPSQPMGKELLPPALGITDTCQHLKIVKVRELEDTNGFVGSAKVQERLIGLQNSDKKLRVSSIQVPDQDRDRFGSGVLSHGFHFKSVYNHEDLEMKEPEATTHHDDWVTVDYMLYTPLESMTHHHHQLQLVNRMRLPTMTQCEKFIKRIPNEACPSDHFPLVATFYLRVRQTESEYDKNSSRRKKDESKSKK